MTTTLLKHEWLRTRGLVGIVAGIAALIALCGATMVALDLPGLAALGEIIVIASIILFIPATQLALAFDFWNSSFGRTGYLTQTLPVRGGIILRAKVLWQFLVSVALLPVAVALWVMLLTAGNIQAGVSANPWPQVQETWRTITAAATPSVTAVVVFILLALLVFPTVQFVFSASVGSERTFQRFGPGGPVLVYVLTYLAIQALSMVFMIAIPYGLGTGSDGRLEVVQTDFAAIFSDDASGGVTPIGFLVAFALASVVLMWRTVRSWNSKISLA